MSQEKECCPKLDPTIWDGKILEWRGKKFIKGKVRTFMYMPINFGPVITKMVKAAEDNGIKMPDSLCLSDHTSKWNMDIYLAVDREVPGMENVELNGKYLSKVYEGNFKETAKWGEDFKNFAKEKGLVIKK